MTPGIVGMVALIIVILGHIITTVWWAATITEKLRTISECLVKISLNDEKNEATHKMLWTRQDDLKTRVAVIETRCTANHKE